MVLLGVNFTPVSFLQAAPHRDSLHVLELNECTTIGYSEEQQKIFIRAVEMSIKQAHLNCWQATTTLQSLQSLKNTLQQQCAVNNFCSTQTGLLNED